MPDPRSGPTRAAALAITAALVLTSAWSARADDDAAAFLEPAVEVHGFVSQGALTTANNYLAESDRGSFEFAEAGINFTKAADRSAARRRAAVRPGPGADRQLLGQGRLVLPRLPLADWLGVRAGRVKLPFGLYNEISDVDAARVPVLLPQSIYPTRNRDFLLAQTGVELYGYIAWAAWARWTTACTAAPSTWTAGGSAGRSPSEFRVPYVVGGRLLWETPLTGLRVGGSVQALRIDFGLSVGVMRANGAVVGAAVGGLAGIRARQPAAGGRVRPLARRGEQSNPMLFPSRGNQGALLRDGGLPPGPWFSPGVYFGLLPQRDDRKGRDA